MARDPKSISHLDDKEATPKKSSATVKPAHLSFQEGQSTSTLCEVDHEAQQTTASGMWLIVTIIGSIIIIIYYVFI